MRVVHQKLRLPRPSTRRRQALRFPLGLWLATWLACTSPAEAPVPVADSSAAPDAAILDTGSADSGSTDTGSADSGSTDTGSADSGSADSGLPDTSVPDTSLPDTSLPDTSLPDTSLPDTSLPDAGSQDTSTPDTSTPDAGSQDTSPPDTSTPDAGSPDASSNTCADDSDCATAERCVGATCVDSLAVWPNSVSKANSDAWLPKHHAQIQQLRPRVLALNFVNAHTNQQMTGRINKIFAALSEASRPYGYKDKAAAPMWQPELAYSIDLRDKTVPAGWKWANSTHYPRETPKDGYWAFDYEQLFSAAFATKMAIPDPDKPGQVLDLCALIERGLVHEIWIYGDADTPGDVNAAEILERKARYDTKRVRLADGSMDGCAGNGCFDAEDTFPAACTRTVRIGWINRNRGPGCFLEGLAHGMEGTGNRKPAIVPYLSALFSDFAGFNLKQKYKLPFESWYACQYSGTCLSYPSATSVTWDIGKGPKTLANYDAVCGNVHFPPNARKHYDLKGSASVQTSCEGFRQKGGIGGADVKTAFTSAAFSAYSGVGQDCMGAWLIWWIQNMPGHGSKAVADDGSPMLSWLPFLYY